MPRDYKLYLRDIVEAARFIERLTQGLTYEAFLADEVRLRAVLNSLTTIGEAARHVPDELRDRTPAIPWREMTGVRNIIVHGYFSVNLTIIWNINEVEISAMRRQVEELLSELEQT